MSAKEKIKFRSICTSFVSSVICGVEVVFAPDKNRITGFHIIIIYNSCIRCIPSTLKHEM